MAKFLAEATMPANELITCRANFNWVFKNVRVGVASITNPEARARIEKLPGVQYHQLTELWELAEATAHAASRLEVLGTGAEKTALQAGVAAKRQLLGQISSCVDFGLIPKAQLLALRCGKGSFATAKSIIEAVALLQQLWPQLGGKLLINEEYLQSALETAAFLRATASKGTAVTPQRAKAIDDRDRLWTLLVNRHDLLRRVAMWVWGEANLDAKVPPLLAHAKMPRKAIVAPDATVAANPTSGPAAAPEIAHAA